MEFEETNVTGKYFLDNNFTNIDHGVTNATDLYLNATLLPSPHTPENSALNYAVLAIIPIIIFVAMGNILVIVAVWLDTRLRSATNCFLSSLAVADLLVALTVMIPSLAMIVNNYEWPFSDEMCGIWVMLDVFFSTSSIFHLCMISFDRYVALARPFHYRNNSGGGNARFGKLQYLVQRKAKTLKRVAIRILLVWVVAFGIAIPIPILGTKNRENLFYGKMCSINIPNFQIFGSLVAFFLPLVSMFVMYTLTIRTLRQQAQLVSSMLVHNCKHSSLNLNRKSSHRRHVHRHASTDNPGCRTCVSTSSQFNDPSQQDDGSPTDSRQSVMVCRQLPNDQSICRHCKSSQENGVENMSAISTGLKQVTKTLQRIQSMLRIGGLRASRPESSSNGREETDMQQSLQEKMVPDRKLTLPPQKERSSVRQVSSSFKTKAMASITNEQRASKVLGLIFALFCLFWCPFFVTNVLSRLCPACNQKLMGQLMNWFVWVGYVSSGVNPIVYTMFSRRFRNTFYLLLKWRIGEINQHKFVRNVSSHDNSGSSLRSTRTTAGSGPTRSSRNSLRLTVSRGRKRSLSQNSSGDDVWSNTRSPISAKITSWREKIQQQKKTRSESENAPMWRSSARDQDDNERHMKPTNEERSHKTFSRLASSASKESDKQPKRLFSETDAASSQRTKDKHVQLELKTIQAGKIARLTSLPHDKTWLSKKDDYSSDGTCSSLESVWSHNFGGTSPSRDLLSKGAQQASRKNNNTEIVCKITSSTSRKNKDVASVINDQCGLPECDACFRSWQRAEKHEVGNETPDESESPLFKRKAKSKNSGTEEMLSQHSQHDVFTFIT